MWMSESLIRVEVESRAVESGVKYSVSGREGIRNDKKSVDGRKEKDDSWSSQ